MPTIPTMDDIGMHCPHLLSLAICSCTAGGAPYVPSLFELQEYCRQARHKRCPFYARFAREYAPAEAVRSGAGS